MASFILETADGGQARQFEFTTPNVSIGRDRGADFTLDHPTVSRQHAVIAWDGQTYRLVILSRGGLTAIDGQQVGGEVPLFDGSRLMFGQLQFIFRSPHAPPKPAQQPAYGQPQQGVQQPVYAPPGTQYPVASTSDMHASQSGIYQDPARGPSPGATADFRSISGQFPSMQEHEKLAQQRQPRAATDGLVTWDEIAAGADDVHEERDALTDFQLMQKAQELADAQNRTISPVFIMVLILAVGLLALAFIYGDSGGGDEGGPEVTTTQSLDPQIAWLKSDLDCIGVAGCREAAINAFNVGKVMLERQESDITNLYEGYKQLDRAGEYLKKAAIDPPPKEMSGMAALKAQAADEMRSLFLRQRANYLAQEDYKDYKKMVAVVNRILAYFPDERLNYHKWAQAKIAQMKQDSVYPQEAAY